MQLLTLVGSLQGKKIYRKTEFLYSKILIQLNE